MVFDENFIRIEFDCRLIKKKTFIEIKGVLFSGVFFVKLTFSYMRWYPLVPPEGM